MVRRIRPIRHRANAIALPPRADAGRRGLKAQQYQCAGIDRGGEQRCSGAQQMRVVVEQGGRDLGSDGECAPGHQQLAQQRQHRDPDRRQPFKAEQGGRHHGTDAEAGGAFGEGADQHAGGEDAAIARRIGGDRALPAKGGGRRGHGIENQPGEDDRYGRPGDPAGAEPGIDQGGDIHPAAERDQHRHPGTGETRFQGTASQCQQDHGEQNRQRSEQQGGGRGRHQRSGCKGKGPRITADHPPLRQLITNQWGQESRAMILPRGRA
ncbi:hypothetical protein P7L68_25580 [Tistrella mobilis]|uniref:hypothetical protein n=1 Tax=Tistrella mobilis TaxID=171437 RepID=UPI0035573225